MWQRGGTVHGSGQFHREGAAGLLKLREAGGREALMKDAAAVEEGRLNMVAPLPYAGVVGWKDPGSLLASTPNRIADLVRGWGAERWCRAAP
jgi:hypothetical protein